MSDQILLKLQSKQRDHKKLLKKLEVLDTEIRTLDEVCDLLAMHIEIPETPKEKTAVNVSQRRERVLSEKWATVLSSFPNNTFDYNDIQDLSDLLGLDISRNTTRSQMKTYVHRGLVESIAQGVFKLTESGKKIAGVKQNAEGSDVGTSEPSNNAEDAKRGHVFGQPFGLPPTSAGED